jgi:hypothetical protein
MRTVVKCIFHVQFVRVIIHLLQEELYCWMRRKWRTTICAEQLFNITEAEPSLLKYFSEILSEGESCIIAAGEHHAVKKLDHREDITFHEVSRCALDLGCLSRDCDISPGGIHSKF